MSRTVSLQPMSLRRRLTLSMAVVLVVAPWRSPTW